MKTKEVLDKYRKVLCPILGCKENELRFFTGNFSIGAMELNPATRQSYQLETMLADRRQTEITEVEYFEPEKDKNDEETGNLIRHTRWNNWSEGHYSVVCKNQLVATFQLYKMPHCCAILVSCKAFVAEKFRNKRVGTMMNQLRQDIGRLLGYSTLMCTDIEQNVHQRQLLKTNGWKDIHDVVNKRTRNRVYISVINL